MYLTGEKSSKGNGYGKDEACCKFPIDSTGFWYNSLCDIDDINR